VFPRFVPPVKPSSTNAYKHDSSVFLTSLEHVVQFETFLVALFSHLPTFTFSLQTFQFSHQLQQPHAMTKALQSLQLSLHPTQPRTTRTHRYLTFSTFLGEKENPCMVRRKERRANNMLQAISFSFPNFSVLLSRQSECSVSPNPFGTSILSLLTSTEPRFALPLSGKVVERHVKHV